MQKQFKKSYGSFPGAVQNPIFLLRFCCGSNLLWRCRPKTLIAEIQEMFSSRLFRRKTLDHLLGETIEPERQLKRALGPVQLTLLGVGAIVGAGIFSTIGTAAAGGADHTGAGPALVLSFALVAVACGFAALCYSEFASMVPVSGST